MAHPMYGIDALLKKYPLVEKAFAHTEGEIEAAVFFIGGEAGVIATPKRLIETVEQTIDGSDAEKQALIIAAMYSLSREARAEMAGRFGAEYNAETQAVMDTLALAEAHDGKRAPAQGAARVGAVLAHSLMALQTEMLTASGPAARIPDAFIQETREQLQKTEALLLPNLDAPRLEALYKKSAQDFLSALESAGQKPPRPRKGPKGPGL